jgi:hypothetical protein
VGTSAEEPVVVAEPQEQAAVAPQRERWIAAQEVAAGEEAAIVQARVEEPIA